MLISFANDTVEVVHPVWVEDSRNIRRATYPDDAPTTVVDGCSVQQGASTEVLGGRDTTAVRWTVLAPAGTTVEETDAVKFEGHRYRVDGHPARQKSPTGALDHVAILLLDWK